MKWRVTGYGLKDASVPLSCPALAEHSAMLFIAIEEWLVKFQNESYTNLGYWEE